MNPVEIKLGRDGVQEVEAPSTTNLELPRTWHHLFNHFELKAALIKALGKPITDKDRNKLEDILIKCKKFIPQIKINEQAHKDLHIQELKLTLVPIIKCKHYFFGIIVRHWYGNKLSIFCRKCGEKAKK